ncbi:hypothetical protein ACKI16_44850 [Streptomyces scabiei]|uniref:hypothetical protein n=1 Tax=Streptomyces scabiei TaxID=1930 RepID=UPI0038F7CCFF
MDLLTVGTVDGRPALLTRGDRHRTVRIWDLTTREELHGRLTSEYTSPSIEFFAAVDDRFGVTEEGRVWDLTASQWIGVQPQRRGALALETLEDRSVILTSHRTEEVHLWDLAAGELLAPPLMGHTSGVCAGGDRHAGRSPCRRRRRRPNGVDVGRKHRAADRCVRLSLTHQGTDGGARRATGGRFRRGRSGPDPSPLAPRWLVGAQDGFSAGCASRPALLEGGGDGGAPIGRQHVVVFIDGGIRRPPLREKGGRVVARGGGHLLWKDLPRSPGAEFGILGVERVNAFSVLGSPVGLAAEATECAQLLQAVARGDNLTLEEQLRTWAEELRRR